ncbi:MAG: hypothetical protein HUJ22_01850 [Gracilimonas sp.]|uniref:hypothetical protein n=1 Tax=Gracilimonas sp. TaxID=1974203 RepID=UPI00198ECC07|nr:hypothetical protein [Gracilimonas sp.]MBD3615287.1 hypothetical protein [Gracilimonas sp.]
MSRLLVIVIFLSFVILSCKNETFEFHPMPERFPYESIDVPIVEINREYSSDIKEEIIKPDESILGKKTFKKYFDFDSTFIIEKPEIDLNSIKYSSLNSTRGIILNPLSNTFLEYDSKNKLWSSIAKSGRGPGELMFPTDFHIKNQKIYVSTKDSRINIFDCQNPSCEFEKSISLNKIQPSSLTTYNENFLVLGLFSSLSQGENSSSNSINPLHFINKSGEIMNSFGEFYKTKNNWMLIQPFEKGSVKNIKIDNQHFYLHYYDKIPELYFLKNKELFKRYIFKDFVNSKHKYNTQNHELFVNVEDWSFLDNITVLNNGKIIVSIRHLSNRSLNEYGIIWDENKDFYLIDLLKDKYSFLGSIDLNDENIWFSKHNIMHLKNDTLSIHNYILK